jgi:tRNA (guanine6-N2)-methyltransferase
MNTYFATFIAGTYELVSRQLKSFSVNELKIIEHDESSVLFESNLSNERLIELRFFTNAYLVVKEIKDVKKHLKGKHYNLVYLKSNSPTTLEESTRLDIQSKIERELALQNNTHLAQNNFYVIERTNGKRILTLRLARAKFKREKLNAGELRPELAHILCLASGVKPKDVVLDMFAGYGSIPLEAVRGFGCREVIAADKDELAKRKEHKEVIWHKADSRNLDLIDDNSIDRVITDPPWGVYDNSFENIDELYSDTLKEISRLLKPNGVAVMLTGYSGAKPLLTANDDLELIKEWPILVSGKKATIYKLKKV